MTHMTHRFFATVVLFVTTVSGLAESLEEQLFTVRRDEREAGSAFLLKQDESVWMVSNYHVVEGDQAVEFVGMTDDSRVYTFPETIEVAFNRDAVRFITQEAEGFSLGADYAFDDVVTAFGNSDGAGVITKSEGTVVGKGRNQIEVTCEIIPGNSGGPVVNANNEVIGVATYTFSVASVKDAAKLSGTVSAAERERLLEKLKLRRGTRYTEARRFAIPLHDAEWQEVELEVFQQESKVFESMEDQYDRFRDATTSFFHCSTISSRNDDIFSKSWIKRYNEKLYKLGYYDSDSGRFYIRSGKRSSFDSARQRWLEDLAETALQLSDTFREKAEELVVFYHQNEVNDRADRLARRNRELLDIAEDYDR
jgi:hypothetical protein